MEKLMLVTLNHLAPHSKLKFYSVLGLHTLLFLGFLLLCRLMPTISLTGRDIVLTAFFSIVYFILVWLDLYSRPYHHYLRNAFFFVFRDLLACSILLVSAEYLVSLITQPMDYTSIIQKDLVLIVFYFAMHLLQYLWIIHLANLGFFRKNVMLVGSYDPRIPVEQLFQNINNTKHFIGQMLNQDGIWYFRADLQSTPQPVQKDLGHFLLSRRVNELIICMDQTISPSSLWECASWCLENSIGYYLIPDISRLPHIYPWQDRFQLIPSVERYCPNRDSLIMISFKRILDIVVAGSALVALLPIFGLVALLIKLQDNGPIFYVSKRVGIHGKLIKFYKFRSMVLNAEALKKDLLALNERPDGPLFKLEKDPRVTPLGRVLRRTSLDELPQFINVLRGDMSLIGPRPHLPEEVAAYSDVDNLRLECIPGIACLPQILGRDSLGFRDWVDLDLRYRKNWSLYYDIRILFDTARVVLRNRR